MRRLAAVLLLLMPAVGLMAPIEAAPAGDPSAAPPRQDGEDAAWKAARAENSPEAYANFLYVYPAGGHSKEAFCRLVGVAEPGGVRVTDAPFFGAVGPFGLDAFFALDAQRQGKPTTVTETFLHTPRGKALLAPLTTLAEHADPAVRLAAVDLLFLLDEFWWLSTLPPQDKSRVEQAFFPGLQALVSEKNSMASAGAAYLLWHLSRQRHAEPVLASLKAGAAPAMRRAAADVLGPMGGPAAIEALAAAMKSDGDPLVRATSAESLAEIGDARAIPPLAAALRTDKQEEVRIAAAVALRVLGDGQAVEPLAEALAGDKSPIVRWVAACALGTLGNARAAAPLTAALADDDRSVRRAAAEALGAMQAAQAVEPLLALLKSEKMDRLRSALIDALGAIGDARAVEPLVDVVKQQRLTGDRSTTTGAALALRAIGEPRAVKLLFAAVDDRDPQVRTSAAFALGILDASPKVLATVAKQHRQRWYRQRGDWPGQRLFDPRTLHRMIEAAAEENAELRESAALAMGMTSDPRVVEPLIAVLKRDRDVRVREAAVRALGMCEDPRTLGPLLAALGDESPRVVLRAVEAVQGVKDPRVGEALVVAMKRDWPSSGSGRQAAPQQEDPLATEELVRKAILTALAHTGHARAFELLVAALAHRSPPVREAAALALGVLHDRRALEPLLAAAKDESSWVREKSATALGMIGDPRAADSLLSMLNDQAPEARDAALRALALLGPPQQTRALGERLAATAVGSHYRMNYWIALFSMGWRPRSPEDCVRLLATQDQRVLLLAIWPSAKKILVADAAAGDAATAQGIAELLIALGRDETLADLTALLKAKGTKNLAATYFHCGKKELREAAASWAQERGNVQLPPNPSGVDVQWGAM